MQYRYGGGRRLALGRAGLQDAAASHVPFRDVRTDIMNDVCGLICLQLRRDDADVATERGAAAVVCSHLPHDVNAAGSHG